MATSKWSMSISWVSVIEHSVLEVVLLLLNLVGPPAARPGPHASELMLHHPGQKRCAR